MPIQYPIQVGNTLTRVLEGGAGPRKMVFVHGLGARADRWRGSLERFAQLGAHTYAVDLPGHGFADKGEGTDCSVPAFAVFLDQFLSSLPEGPTVLVGTSIGGHVCVRLVATATARVDALVLVDTMGLSPLGQDRRSLLASGLTSITAEGTRTKMSSLLGRDARDAEVAEEYRINTSPGADIALHALAGYVRDSIDDDLVGDLLQTIALPPILIVWGETDVALPLALGDETARALPGTQLRVMAGCGHAPYLEEPDAFVSIVWDFLRERMP